ncbi:MAG: 16S rRNA (guanine(527)-N(7))-methyltransferase RsmG [Oscillospiraceae bacterium]|nr:16S rRNA (guanine(527)-N(7))-methyltransferase RsmG [Oscillospiraceae bacterium]
MIKFTPPQENLLNKMSSFMLEYNRQVNLTAIKDPSQVWEKHFIDSVYPLILHEIPQGASVIDVGTGAGFPGVVWKIYRPDLGVTLLDSLRKRVDYLRLLQAELGLDYSAIHGRSEELALRVEHRGRYDVAVSRAVANLPALCEFCLPFVKLGGVFLAMKGPESEAADNALKLLGGAVERAEDYALPQGDKRRLLVIRKVAETPPEFPRRRVNIGKKPL